MTTLAKIEKAKNRLISEHKTGVYIV